MIPSARSKQPRKAAQATGKPLERRKGKPLERPVFNSAAGRRLRGARPQEAS